MDHQEAFVTFDTGNASINTAVFICSSMKNKLEGVWKESTGLDEKVRVAVARKLAVDWLLLLRCRCIFLISLHLCCQQFQSIKAVDRETDCRS